MTSTSRLVQRIVRGKQQQEVLEALKVPRTGKEILEIVRKKIPRMSYQDLRHILRGFQDKGIAVCLNPQNQTGRLYVLTQEQDKHMLSLPEIELQAKLRRAKVRIEVLREIGRDHEFDLHPLTASQIRKNLLERCPLNLNHVLSALKYLQAHQLITVVGQTAKRDLKIFGLTDLGKQVLAISQQADDTSNCI